MPLPWNLKDWPINRGAAMVARPYAKNLADDVRLRQLAPIKMRTSMAGENLRRAALMGAPRFDYRGLPVLAGHKIAVATLGLPQTARRQLAMIALAHGVREPGQRRNQRTVYHR